MNTKLKAKPNHFRIIGVDLFSHEDYLVDDFESQQSAFDAADRRNKARSGSMSDVYYVYDDNGRIIRDQSAVGGTISP